MLTTPVYPGVPGGKPGFFRGGKRSGEWIGDEARFSEGLGKFRPNWLILLKQELARGVM
jgi:hypothetical protein